MANSKAYQSQGDISSGALHMYKTLPTAVLTQHNMNIKASPDWAEPWATLSHNGAKNHSPIPRIHATINKSDQTGECPHDTSLDKRIPVQIRRCTNHRSRSPMGKLLTATSVFFVLFTARPNHVSRPVQWRLTRCRRFFLFFSFFFFSVLPMFFNHFIIFQI